jgi:RES domain-containing protein
MVYAATNIALAALETIVHFNAASLPLNRYLVQIDVPDDVWNRALTMKPNAHVGWDALPAGKTSIDWGTAWIAGGDCALAFVPSVIAPEEFNCLINPRHADVARLKATKRRKWIYDARLNVVVN